MGVHVIRVPDLGEGIAEVELVIWHVAAGDSIVEDQGLADVMTDKASVEIPSPAATCQTTSSTSAMPSPRSGTRMTCTPMSVAPGGPKVLTRPLGGQRTK